MIALDTNVLVRHLTQDDPVQSAKATNLIERQLSEDVPGFISVVVMIEMAWVLQSVYRLSNPDIAVVVGGVLQIENLVVEYEEEIFTAMVAVQEGRGSFADALIGALASKAGCQYTLTFDRGAIRLPGFKLL